MIDSTLCLACSSSLVSRKQAAHITKCCSQIICDHCVQANPRLATYDPCLGCLGGVDASRGKLQSQKTLLPQMHSSAKSGLLNTVCDNETMFVLGDDSDEDYQGANNIPNKSANPVNLPLATPPLPSRETSNPARALAPAPVSSLVPKSSPVASPKYFINPSDTIHGVALRFGVDALDLCRTNGLPISTLSTTPHLLHTRVFLTLPPSSKPIPLQYVLSEEDQAKRETQRTKERAEKMLQMVTKEVDWRVAKTYVMLANSPELDRDKTDTCKENSGTKDPLSNLSGGQSSAEVGSRALDLYLEDAEWEQNELNAGRCPSIPGFPIPNQDSATFTPTTKAKWWQWG